MNNTDEPLRTDSHQQRNARIGPHQLPAVVTIPNHPIGIIIFAHGSDSIRVSPRNQILAQCLQNVGFATLQFDFLTASESCERENHFRVELLTKRLHEIIEWVKTHEELAKLALGIFASGTGMVAAINVAATNNQRQVQAIVSRGGCTELAKSQLSNLRVPTLMIVGQQDVGVLHENRQAKQLIQGECEVVQIPGATHLFSESGKLNEVKTIATQWFQRHLNSSRE